MSDIGNIANRDLHLALQQKIQQTHTSPSNQPMLWTMQLTEVAT